MQSDIRLFRQAVAETRHNQIVDLGFAILRNQPNNGQVRECVALAGLLQDRVQDVSHLLIDAPTTGSFRYSYPYFLYKTRNFERCISHIKSNKPDDKLTLLLAQAYFLSGDTSQALATLSILFKSKDLQSFKQDILTNILACGPDAIPMCTQIRPQENTQAVYNHALLLTELGNFQQARKQLAIYESLLTKDSFEEILTVKLLRDYIDSGSLPLSSLRQLHHDYLRLQAETTNRNLKYILQNNAASLSCQLQIQTPQSVAQHQKILEEANIFQHKLSRRQCLIVKLNRLLVLVYRGRSEAHKVLEEIEQSQQIQQLGKNISFIKAKYLLLRKSSQKQADELISRLQSFNATAAALFKVDLAKIHGSMNQVVELLKNCPVSNEVTMVFRNHLFELMLNDQKLFMTSSDLLGLMLNNSTDTNQLKSIYRLYASHSDTPKMIEIMSKVVRLDPRDQDAKITLAQLLLSTDGLTAQVRELINDVEPPEEVTDKEYLQYIERNIHASKSEGSEGNLETQAVSEPKEGTRRRIKKRRRIRLPKNMERYIENFKPDSQRWLPKWQRKGYKPKGKDKSKHARTQGMASAAKEETKNIFATKASTSTYEVSKSNKRRK